MTIKAQSFIELYIKRYERARSRAEGLGLVNYSIHFVRIIEGLREIKKLDEESTKGGKQWNTRYGQR